MQTVMNSNEAQSTMCTYSDLFQQGNHNQGGWVSVISRRGGMEMSLWANLSSAHTALKMSRGSVA